MAVVAERLEDRMPTRRTLERLIAVGYGLTYDAVVRGFAPYQALLDEIAGLVARARPAAAHARATRVLDIACGVGTVAAHLARAGHAVTAVDAVGHLVDVARRHHGARGLDLSFQHLDVARDPLPGAGSFDVLVSMHTLYWHPEPEALLEGCRRAVAPGGHGVFLTYARPARVGRIFREVRATRGLAEAVRALRWLVPTALFEALRRDRPRYLSRPEFHRALAAAGFEVLESRHTFLAGISDLAWTRAGAQRG
jgi:2-polyprenyl-3-methyl-5-hydroxy-6-metoxy-1,4-benzoquinol methylase